MAQKRMFNKLVINSDDFLEMPDSSQVLYFHLSMNADDDGFIDNWKSIMRMTGKKEDDLKILIAKAFIIPFNSGVIVIRHWRLNNYLQKDRYKETIYKKEKNLLSVDDSNVYNMYTECIPSIDKTSIDKISIDKNNNNKSDSCVNGSEEIIDSRVDGLVDVVDFFENNIGLITPYSREVIEDYLKEMPKELIIFAMKKAVEADKRTIQYIKGILNNWEKKGIKTLIEAQKEDEKFKNRKTSIGETEEESLERKQKILEEGLK